MSDVREHSGPEISERSMPVRWRDRLIRPKGNIEPRALSVLVLLGAAPLVMVVCRFLAFPGVEVPEFIDVRALHGLGVWLNQYLSLEWVPPDDRPTILYLLLLPTGALMIALARLTFGLRILGFRAILIAIGFQIAGIVPSLLLIAFVVAAILLIRPWMRRIRLPLFARVSVILCLAALIMVSALLLAPLLRSEIVWSVAFFPVIIVAMLAEGIAKTLANDSAVMAAWRATWTLLVALIIAWICTRPIIRDVALRFPELLVTNLVMIVVIAEFFDLRLLESWPARISERLKGNRRWFSDRPIVAVVRNRWNTGVIGRLGHATSPRYRKRSVQRIVDALRKNGFAVKVLEGDMDLLKELSGLLPPNPKTGLPSGLVFNLSTGVQGSAGFCQVPAMLELAGIAYTGPDPIAQAHLLDRHTSLTLLRNAGIRVPRSALIADSSIEIGDLDYPLTVRARCDPGARPIVAQDSDALLAAATKIHESMNQQAVVEEACKGREIRVSLIGNNRLECLPLLERGAARKGRKVCPASLNDDTAMQIRDAARGAFIAAGCRDYARIDVRLPDDGTNPIVVAVNWDGVLARRGSLATSAAAGGYTYDELMLRIVEEAALRYGAKPISPERQSNEVAKVPALPANEDAPAR